MEEKTSLTQVEAQPIIPVAAVGDDILAIAEKRVDTFNKIKLIALRATNKMDWVDQDGSPYLQGSGSEKVGRLFGLDWKLKSDPRKVNSDDDRGPFYYYEVRILVSSKSGDTIESIGTCSSRDSFFAKAKGAWRLLSEIDETNILKSAYTNALSNGVTKLLGLRNLTWEEVEKFAGFKRGDVAQVRHEQNPEVAAKESQQRAELTTILEAALPGNLDEQKKALVRITEFPGKDGKIVAGIDDVNRLSGKRLDVTLSKARDAMAKFQAVPK